MTGWFGPGGRTGGEFCRVVGAAVACLGNGREGLSRCLLSRAHKHERPPHIHRHRDELQMTGVAGKPPIADAAHPIPALHRGEGALDG